VRQQDTNPSYFGGGHRPVTSILESSHRADVKLSLIDIKRCDLAFSRYSRSRPRDALSVSA